MESLDARSVFKRESWNIHNSVRRRIERKLDTVSITREHRLFSIQFNRNKIFYASRSSTGINMVGIPDLMLERAAIDATDFCR